jgi:hypothetical protein
VLHGAIVLLVGQLAGLPTATESLAGDTVRFWHTAHEALIMVGILMIAASSALPVIVLGARERLALVWTLFGLGYGFMVALTLGGIVGVSPFAPGHTPAAFLAFLAAIVGIFGAVVSSALMIMGARAALKAVPAVPEPVGRV